MRWSATLRGGRDRLSSCGGTGTNIGRDPRSAKVMPNEVVDEDSFNPLLAFTVLLRDFIKEAELERPV